MGDSRPDYEDEDYEITEFQGDDPLWMMELASNPAFAHIPAGNLQKLLERFEPMQGAAGQVLIRQGEEGDYYYLMRQGTAQVTRQAPDGQTTTLAELGPGQGFGEEALISGQKRNATVTLSEDSQLMRLAAVDFDQLLRLPLVNGLDADEAVELLRGGGQFVDVRTPAEFRQGSLKGAINLPLSELRGKAQGLERQRAYLLFCDNGRRAATAAFLLAQRGFATHVLAANVLGTKKTPTAG